MMFSSRNYLWIVPLSVVFLWPVWGDYAARLLAPQYPEQLGDSVAIPVEKYVMEEALLVQSRDGMPEWKIAAARLHTEDAGAGMFFDQVDASFYEDSNLRYEISSGSGTYESIKKMLTLAGDVVVVSREGFVIRAPTLSYDEKKRVLTSREKVKIAGEGMAVDGKGLRYQMDDGAFSVGGRVVFETR